jgi:GTP-binding protein EngB required for normal cell division
MKLVHSIFYGPQLREFTKGIREDDYEFYDNYFGCKEVVITGSSNSGKSSFINALNDNVTESRTSKRSGKTQALQFYICQKSENVNKKMTYRGFIVDTPGYGYTYAPVKVKN